MQELARVTLENEMDLILAHKRSMKLGELMGLPLSAQTTFATAVSEVSRNTIENGKSGVLTLGIENGNREKYIVARIKDQQPDSSQVRSGLEYAKRLVNKYEISSKGAETTIDLYYYFSVPFRIDINQLDEWRTAFRNEPPMSAYEELKRKNEQLQDLSDRVQQSEARYKTLTNSLPMIIFSVDLKGQVLYANDWLSQFTGESVNALNDQKWKQVVHESDYDAFSVILHADKLAGSTAVRTQARIRPKAGGDYLWHQVFVAPFYDEKKELQYWTGYLVDIHAQKIFEETLRDNIELQVAQKELKQNQAILEQYIDRLNASNLELQQFAFIASHDLQEPVRKLLFYSDSLLSRYSENIDQKSGEYIRNIQTASHRMRDLIRDLLLFSQVNNEASSFQQIDLNEVATEALQDLELVIKEKKALIEVQSLPSIEADKRMIRQLFENLIGNSLKYAKKDQPPHIRISYIEANGYCEISFQDNGIGFDKQYLQKIFTLFQRLHTRESYAGTGLGLAICRKIVERHQGTIWADSREGEGATFYVSIPIKQTTNS